jgi:nicotinamide-nucleotide amidase
MPNILAQQLGEALLARGMTLATAESCTGGGVAQAVTDIAGSSAWFERGFVTYANVAKVEMLGVRQSTLEAHGAVSEMTVREMALGALGHSGAHIALAVQVRVAVRPPSQWERYGLHGLQGMVGYK